MNFTFRMFVEITKESFLLRMDICTRNAKKAKGIALKLHGSTEHRYSNFEHGFKLFINIFLSPFSCNF